MTTPKNPEFVNLHYLRKNLVDPNPIKQFQNWYREAQVIVPNLAEAVTLATASAQGKPSARMVLLKHFDNDGFIFFTDYRSQKGKELSENPRAAMVLHWRQLQKQIRITGDVKRISLEESRIYFKTRPRGSQIAAHTSKQSQVVDNRTQLEKNYQSVSEQFQEGEIPLPSQWGGFRLNPSIIEFWQHRENRLHDRLLYSRKSKDEWLLQRLSP